MNIMYAIYYFVHSKLNLSRINISIYSLYSDNSYLLDEIINRGIILRSTEDRHTKVNYDIILIISLMALE